MTLDEFKRTLQSSSPPDVEAALKALWHDARGDWETAHHVAQDIGNSAGAWVHAYLHRKEGDLSNARYWYARAGKPDTAESLEEEWTSIAAELLSERS